MNYSLFETKSLQLDFLFTSWRACIILRKGIMTYREEVFWGQEPHRVLSVVKGKSRAGSDRGQKWGLIAPESNKPPFPLPSLKSSPSKTWNWSFSLVALRIKQICAGWRVSAPCSMSVRSGSPALSRGMAALRGPWSAVRSHWRRPELTLLAAIFVQCLRVRSDELGRHEHQHCTK